MVSSRRPVPHVDVSERPVVVTLRQQFIEGTGGVIFVSDATGQARVQQADVERRRHGVRILEGEVLCLGALVVAPAVNRNAQFRLLKSRWTAEKIARRLSKWSVWLLIAAGLVRAKADIRSPALLPDDDTIVLDFDNEYRAISHAQIELIAAKASHMNGCFY